MRVAVVGLGFGELHARALSKIEEISELALCDRDQKRLLQVAEKYDKVTYLTTSYQEVLTDKTIQAVTLAIPHYLHYALAEKALQSDKHVYCEKPLTTDFESGKRLVKLAQERNLLLTTGLNMRYYEHYQKAHLLLQQGAIGKVFLVECFARANARGLGGFRLKKEQAGGGCLIDSGAHRFDLLRWLLGPIKEIYAKGGNFVLQQMEGEDTAVVNLHFENGILGTMVCSWGTQVPKWDEGINIYGDQGTLYLWDHNLSLRLRNYQGKEEIYIGKISYEDSVLLSIKDFIEKIHIGNFQIDLVRNLAHLQLVEAAYQSMQSNIVFKINNPI
ncbi:Gfo/Idh/MocA family protein [Atrimonas thermophila]|jgi:predicted dehydrogenase|uniref:Gfo/Idh/MocA family protein n=1 Tax=Atrimonas thermophila TaxID=3064161 RepID=UPI00399D155B